ncbi:MAG: EthD family reductase [Acidobacteria bacterium]|nr:EthD family reductase [Acidobacteriota bacterium]
MIRVSVLYPKGAKFDFDYYVKRHMQLVHKLLDPYGLVKTEVDRSLGDDSPFMAAGHLYFNTAEDMQKGLQAHDPELAADGVNYTDVKPQFQVSEIIA